MPGLFLSAFTTTRKGEILPGGEGSDLGCSGDSVPDDLDTRHRVLELLMPGGQPVGESGYRRSDIRTVRGSLEDAQQFFDELRTLGEPLYLDIYPGEMVAVGGAGDVRHMDRVGFRPHSKSGEPTIEVWVEYIPEIWKIKFVDVNSDYAR